MGCPLLLYPITLLNLQLMPAWLVAIFEILKFTIPALIMFWAVQSLFKQFLQGQQQMRLMEIKQQQSNAQALH